MELYRLPQHVLLARFSGVSTHFVRKYEYFYELMTTIQDHNLLFIILQIAFTGLLVE
jgi:hypothetical protein